jgi:hypothetical protein
VILHLFEDVHPVVVMVLKWVTAQCNNSATAVNQLCNNTVTTV